MRKSSERNKKGKKFDFFSFLGTVPGVPGIVTFIDKNIEPLIFRLQKLGHDAQK
jgi:hypothetical protein